MKLSFTAIASMLMMLLAVGLAAYDPAGVRAVVAAILSLTFAVLSYRE